MPPGSQETILTVAAGLLLAANGLILPIRVLAAVAVAPLLYRALGEPGQGWNGPAPEIARRAFFAVLGSILFFLLTASWVPAERRPDQGRGFDAYARGVYLYRISQSRIGDAARGAAARPPEEEALAALRRAARLTPESVSYRRHLGIVLAERGRYDEALEELAAAMEVLARRAPERARAEAALWRALYGPDEPAPAEISAARAQLRQFGLGWWADVAAAAAYERLDEAVPRELRQGVQAQADRYFRGVLGATAALLMIPQLGLIALVVGAVLIRTGVLRPAPREQHPVGAILWEGFILMLALGLLPGLLAFGGRRPVPETQPGLFSALLLASDATQLLAVVYVWWRLRGRGLTLAEIGLTGRSFWVNVLIGVGAAFILMPTAVLIGVITQAVSERLFPNIAPPYHPLAGLTATSTNEEIRVALFVAAAVGAPILEEIFFRGALFGALRRRYGVWPGLLGSAGIFAILHPQLPLGFLPIALLGAAFAALYEWRQSLVAPIVAHAINNGTIFILMNVFFPARG